MGAGGALPLAEERLGFLVHQRTGVFGLVSWWSIGDRVALLPRSDEPVERHLELGLSRAGLGLPAVAVLGGEGELDAEHAHLAGEERGGERRDDGGDGPPADGIESEHEFIQGVWQR